MAGMPHSYGADFSAVGRRGPSTLDSSTEISANPAPSAIMRRMESQPCIGDGGVYLGGRGRARVACEPFRKPRTLMLAHRHQIVDSQTILYGPAMRRACGSSRNHEGHEAHEAHEAHEVS